MAARSTAQPTADMDPATRRILLAGSFGPERLAARVDPNVADWFEPLHVRDPGAARGRLASQVAAGADVVIAPTWQTHRRALLPVGETRRARAWTADAAAVARQAMDAGLERRALAAQERVESNADGPTPDDPPDRPNPLVAGVLPRLDDEAGVQTGRLAPADVAQERDYRDQAGLLADAGVDFILIEALTTVSSTRAALDAVVATGLPGWIAAPVGLAPTDPDASSLERWATTCIDAGAARLLAPPVPTSGADAALDVMAAALRASDRTWGAQVEGPSLAVDDAAVTASGAWLEQGASVVARLDLATSESLARLRGAIDAYESVSLGEARARHQRQLDFIESAARMAPGGLALEVRRDATDASPAGEALTHGFDWHSALPHELAQMPPQRFRLIVSLDNDIPAATLAPLVETGGLLVLETGSLVPSVDSMRVVRIDDAATPGLALLRRED